MELAFALAPVQALEPERLPEDAAPLWLHLDRNREGIQQRLERYFPAHLVEAALAEEARPRFQLEEGGLLLILKGINFNPGKEAEDMVSLRCLINDQHLITLAGQGLRSVVRVQQLLSAGPRQKDTWAVLGELMKSLIKGADGHLHGLGDEMGELESLWLKKGRDSRTRLLVLEQDLLALRRYLEPQQRVLTELVDDGAEELPRQAVRLLLEVDDRMQRVLDLLVLLRERAKLLRDDMDAARQVSMNRILYFLSIITVLFLPMSVVTGFFGMNVGGLPWLDDPRGWEWVSLIMVALFGLGTLAMWWRRWF
ncbi:CorA family divalent cation transporter [Gallaecimonas sp. GXIMD4217]|uniref:CorA family divalent cation transporter n=1 Tax=Gallaecimonas sp. GXIMD4217 TaxID=3131927 RepID=UPI00311B3CA6